jgi:hypothetical protein
MALAPGWATAGPAAAELGISPSPVGQPAFAAFVKEQVNQLAPTVKGAGVKL